MSWDGYLTGYLTQKADCSGMLTEAGIYSQAGAKCAAKGNEPTADEVKAMVAIIKSGERGKAVTIKGTKYQQIMLDQDSNKAYYKISGGGLITVITKTLFIYGIFKTSEAGTVKGAKKNQNQGDAASLVESLQEALIAAGS